MHFLKIFCDNICFMIIRIENFFKISGIVSELKPFISTEKYENHILHIALKFSVTIYIYIYIFM